MLFNTFDFAAFFLVVYAVYRALPWRAQNHLLLVASYVFYGLWSWKFLGLIAASTVVDYLCARGIHRSGDPRRRKALLWLSLAVNLGALGFFKYYNFFAENLGQLLLTLGLNPRSMHLDIVLPVGISFYTFQTMSYSIDVFRRRLEPTDDPLAFATFVALFPQLVAGPIERASHLLPQLLGPRRVDRAAIRGGLWLLLVGYFKKTVIADNLAPIADAAFAAPLNIGSLQMLIGIYAFAFQIYGDFSGYSAIARGLARLMGFDFMQNFDRPYLATDPSDFWRRWHISLSTWLRDYLYIPLGGNRRGAARTWINLCLTMLLGGLWHGAAWHFVAWGAYHGGLLVAHRILQPVLAALRLPRAVKIALFFQLTCVGWVLFRVTELGDVVDIARSLAQPLELTPYVGAMAAYLGLLIAPLALAAPEPRGLRARLGALVMTVFILVFGSTTAHEFIYFQF